MQKHLVFTNGRSGSNHVANVLNANPALVNYGEVLGSWTAPSKLRELLGLFPEDSGLYLDWIYRSRSFFTAAQVYSTTTRLKRREKPRIKHWSRLKSIGIKEFQINFTRHKLDTYMLDRPDLKVINLYRPNLLRRYISVQAMAATGIVANRGSETRLSDGRGRKDTYIPCSTLIEQLSKYAQETAEQHRLVNMLSTPQVFNLSYDDYFESPADRSKCNQQLFDFLEVPSVEDPSGHGKVLPHSLRDSIQNFDEVRERLTGTIFEQYLSD